MMDSVLKSCHLSREDCNHGKRCREHTVAGSPSLGDLYAMSSETSILLSSSTQFGPLTLALLELLGPIIDGNAGFLVLEVLATRRLLRCGLSGTEGSSPSLLSKKLPRVDVRSSPCTSTLVPLTLDTSFLRLSLLTEVSVGEVRSESADWLAAGFENGDTATVCLGTGCGCTTGSEFWTTTDCGSCTAGSGSLGEAVSPAGAYSNQQI